MSIWIFLVIPIIGALILLKFFNTKLTWWEVLIPMISCIFFIGVFKLIVETVQVSDTEYHGAIIVKARYYEPWETYVYQTCTRSVACGTDSKGNTQYCTETYDCSYCSDHNEYWEVTNSLGESFTVSEKYYRELIKKWSAKPVFVELNRSINYHFGCGRDGDAYEIRWDGYELTSESTTTSHRYENRVQAAHTAFDFPKITENDIKTYSLLEYPKLNGFQQMNVVGADSIPWMTGKEKYLFYQLADYMNGRLGPEKHARIYFVLFLDKPHLAGKMQEAYWDGGNDNELVICIGLSKNSREIQWVYPFTWSSERKIIPDIRESIMTIKNFNVDSIVSITSENVIKQFKRKDFKEFSYITVDPPEWAKWVTFFITSIITGFICYWAVTNDINSKNDPLEEAIRDLRKPKNKFRY